MDLATRSADWLGQVVDLMREPSAVVPVPALLLHLGRAFDVAGSTWNWFDPDGSFGMVADPVAMPLQQPEVMAQWASGELFDAHALLHWFRRTGDLRPQTIARVPTRILSRRRRLPLDRVLAGTDTEQQLSITYRHSGPTHRAFVLQRGGRDFDDEDLAFACVVQRSLVAVDHQVTVVQRLTGARIGTDLGLTGRELAVLQLISEGMTTRLAARTLTCSPRTIEKHLENSYRRLAVRDRINAVRVLRAAGVVGEPATPDHRAVVGPGAHRGAVLLEPPPALVDSSR